MQRAFLAVNRLLARVAGVALALLMFFTVADVLGRYLLNYPIAGTFELTEMSMVLIVFLALGLAEQRREHIALDLAYNAFSPGVRGLVDPLVAVVSLGVVAAMTWQLFAYARRMSEGAYTTAVLQVPVYPFVYVALVGCGLYALAIVMEAVASDRAKKGTR